MKGTKRSYYFVLGAIVLVYLLIQFGASGEEEPINWRESFSRQDKVPFGTYILYKEIESLFPDSEIYDTRKTVYETLNDWNHYDEYHTNTSYLFINDDFDLGMSDLDELFLYVRNGNTAFIAARFFPDAMRDSLGFEIGAPIFGETGEDSISAKFYNPHIDKREGFDFTARNLTDHFTQIDTLATEVLARNNQGDANLVRIGWGEGIFYICSAPIILTNHELLDTVNQRYASHALSHLPRESNLIWDEYYKVDNLLRKQYNGSALQYINSQPALKYAFWLIIASVILYVVFEIKRTQRIVPIMKPKPNSTKEFTETVGELYYQSGNHKNIADKKIKIFLEHIRSNYFLKTATFDAGFQRALAGKSGISEEEVKVLFRKIYGAQRVQYISENDLIELTELIDKFLHTTVG